MLFYTFSFKLSFEHNDDSITLHLIVGLFFFAHSIKLSKFLQELTFGFGLLLDQTQVIGLYFFVVSCIKGLECPDVENLPQFGRGKFLFDFERKLLNSCLHIFEDEGKVANTFRLGIPPLKPTRSVESHQIANQ